MTVEVDDWLTSLVNYYEVSEWVIKFNGLSQRVDTEVHVIHISRVIITYALESLPSLIKITYNLQVTLNFRKKE